MLTTLGALTLILAADLVRARNQLEQFGQTFLQHVSDRALVSETAVEGFAAFVASMDELNHDKAGEYARNLLKRYPFLYMFEIARRVPHSEREALESTLAQRYPGFRIKHFSYESDRVWRGAAPATYYYPLVFQEPLLDGEENLLGLDIHSGEHLKIAMQTSSRRGEPVATYPFDLAEGGRGYVLHRPVRGDDLDSSGAVSDAPVYVLLALKSHMLFSDLSTRPARVDLRLLHREIDTDNEVLVSPAQAASAVEQLLLPIFRDRRTLNLDSQPFVLELEWQLGWGDLRLSTMLGVLLGSLLLFVAVRTYAEQYIHDKFLALEKEGRLYQLANFDSLTGLANRNHLIDFLESALARAQRHGHQLAVLFIDVNEFKAINDTYGHSVGDSVLVEVARRLSQELREDDLLARYGGDEFVWVSADSKEDPDLDGLITRLKRSLRQPVVTGKKPLAISISIGSAVFPVHGANIASLFDVADEGMYRDKRGASAGACTDAEPRG